MALKSLTCIEALGTGLILTQGLFFNQLGRHPTFYQSHAAYYIAQGDKKYMRDVKLYKDFKDIVQHYNSHQISVN
jgi:hypothetical protein